MLCHHKFAGDLSILQWGKKKHRIGFGDITEVSAELGCEYNAYVEYSAYILETYQLMYCTVDSIILLYISCISYTACVMCAVTRSWWMEVHHSWALRTTTLLLPLMLWTLDNQLPHQVHPSLVGPRGLMTGTLVPHMNKPLLLVN